MEERDRYVTELDKIGMQRALEKHVERLEDKFWVLCDRALPGKISSLESVDDLIKREREREKDGFPRRIRWRKVLVGSGKVVTVPYVEEGKLVHGRFEPKNIERLSSYGENPNNPDIGESPGSGDGEVGDVIGHVPLGRGGDDGDDGDDGDGDVPGPGPRPGEEPADHLEEEAYEMGKRLTKEWQLPNLKKKSKKFPTEEYTYDLTDRHRRSGQVLDTNKTLKEIVKTNVILGRVDEDDFDPTNIVVNPEDLVYRVLSRERIWRSKAVVFFGRDYSGSMWGEPTRALVSQHLMIFGWLLYRYEKRVIPRFFVHDTEAREVTAQQYFTMSAYGGTYIPSLYREITKTVRGEGLEKEHDIYLFQGTDGDDGDFEGETAIPEIQKILGYVSRMGVTLFKHPYYGDRKTVFEQYVEKSNILAKRDVFRMYLMPRYWGVTEEMNIQAIKALIAQD